MTSISQIFRSYRVLERPKPGQISLNQATIAQMGQKETNGPFLVMCQKENECEESKDQCLAFGLDNDSLRYIMLC